MAAHTLHARMQQLLRTHTDAHHICIILHNERFLVAGISRRHDESDSHAETNAIRELTELQRRNRHETMRGLTLVVARVKKGRLRESKPCAKCCAAIRAARVFKDVCYSTASGCIETMRACELQSDYVTTGDAYRSSMISTS